MLISLSNKIAVFAMTKTGSTSVEATLAPYCDILLTRNPAIKHMQFRRYERFIVPYLKSVSDELPQSVCLFREPIDWLGSWYRYRQRPKIRTSANSTADMSFDGFVDAYIQDDPPAFARVGQQSKFVQSRDNSVGIDRLFKYENFAEFADFLEQKFGQRFEFPKLNVSKPATLSLSDELRARAREKLKEDYHIYDNLAL